ncbi:MAG: Na+/H+ antiporter NhaC family protein [Bacteroidota bacterium]
MARLVRLLVLVLLFGFSSLVSESQAQVLEAPQVVLNGIPFDVTVRAEGGSGLQLRADQRAYPVTLEDGEATVTVTLSDGGTITLQQNGATIAETAPTAIPRWFSILPPLLVIVIALVTKRVIPSLFLGLWLGAWAALGLSGTGFLKGLFDAFQIYILGALADADHGAVILFTFMIGGLVGIISKNGGMQGVVSKIAGWASSAKKGQLSTAMLGLVVFFDDYANTLVVGNTMRPVTDRLRISREKLAYLVDSTAAPVATLALVTTWIGFQVGLIGAAVDQIDGLDVAAYSVFLNSLPYSFYPVLAIFFVLVVANSGRDFGPMYEAEVRARTTGQVLGPGAKVDTAAESEELEPKSDKPQRALNAILPIAVLVIGVIVGLFITGEGDTVQDIIGDADSYKALMWASLAGVMTAAVLSIGQRILSLEETVEAWYAGLRSMLFAMIILVMAWALSSITEVLHTADFLVALLGDAIAPGFLPFLIFLLAAVTAFSTGSSWGTMGILMPLVIPLTWAVLEANAMTDPEHYHILYSAVSCILAGAVWGDHCTPISDTTILSSMASGCDHIEHVRTQLPYALLVGGVALVIGTLPTGFGFPWWVSFLLGFAVLSIGMRMFGKKADAVTA